MPRKADPNLENVIVNSAVRILDKHGLEAITMRDVAKAAATTTPTLYERFSDRDALVLGVLDTVAYDLYDLMKAERTIEDLSEVFLEYCVRHPKRMDLIHQVWPHTLKTNRRRPTYDLVLERLRKDHKVSPRKAEDIASALMSVLLGAAVLIIGSGAGSEFGRNTRRTALKAVKAICAGF